MAIPIPIEIPFILHIQHSLLQIALKFNLKIILTTKYNFVEKFDVRG